MFPISLKFSKECENLAKEISPITPMTYPAVLRCVVSLKKLGLKDSDIHCLAENGVLAWASLLADDLNSLGGCG